MTPLIVFIWDKTDIVTPFVCLMDWFVVLYSFIQFVHSIAEISPDQKCHRGDLLFLSLSTHNVQAIIVVIIFFVRGDSLTTYKK